jgi:hypothetical protein
MFGRLSGDAGGGKEGGKEGGQAGGRREGTCLRSAAWLFFFWYAKITFSSASSLARRASS